MNEARIKHMVNRDTVEKLREIGDGKTGLPAEAADEIIRLRLDNEVLRQEVRVLRERLKAVSELACGLPKDYPTMARKAQGPSP